MTPTRAPSSCRGCGPLTETHLCCTTCWSSPRTVSACVCVRYVSVSRRSLWSPSGKQLLTRCLPHSHLLETDIWRMVPLHKCTSRFLINKPSSLPHRGSLSPSFPSSFLLLFLPSASLCHRCCNSRLALCQMRNGEWEWWWGGGGC